MIICVKCGHQTVHLANYCSECGHNLPKSLTLLSNQEIEDEMAKEEMCKRDGNFKHLLIVTLHRKSVREGLTKHPCPNFCYDCGKKLPKI